MKIAYLSQSALSDVDFSYIKEAQKIMDISYYIQVYPTQRQKAAVNFKSLPNRFGIFKASDILELQIFGSIVDLSKVYVINYTTVRNYQFKNLAESYKVYKELKKKDYDVIHLTWPPSYLDLFIYRLKKKLILTVHDPFSHSSVVSSIREYERKRAFKIINHLVLLNESQKEEFISLYQLKNGNKHIYTSYLSSYDYLHIHDNKIGEINYNQILFFGQIFSHKGIDYLLSAMEEVHRQKPLAKLIVAGSGSYWFDISRYRNCGYVEIVNRYIPDDELVALISTSAFVVVPYIDATQSGVIMTAYAFNKPCIATNVGALPEMVIDGENGEIVPPKDSKALSDAIIKLLNDPDLLKNYSNSIQTHYRSGTKSWEYIAMGFRDIYKQVSL